VPVWRETNPESPNELAPDEIEAEPLIPAVPALLVFKYIRPLDAFELDPERS
jgi:hypothetical protein